VFCAALAATWHPCYVLAGEPGTPANTTPLLPDAMPSLLFLAQLLSAVSFNFLKAPMGSATAVEMPFIDINSIQFTPKVSRAYGCGVAHSKPTNRNAQLSGYTGVWHARDPTLRLPPARSNPSKARPG
jgi:hypothetical protein